MKRFLLGCLFLVCFAGWLYAQPPVSGIEFRVLQITQSASIDFQSGNLNLQRDIGFPGTLTFKEVQVGFQNVNRWLCRYSYLFPEKNSGSNVLKNKLVFKDATFGPQNVGETNTKPTYLEFNVGFHKLDVGPIFQRGSNISFAPEMVLISHNNTLNLRQEDQNSQNQQQNTTSQTQNTLQNNIKEAISQKSSAMVGIGLMGLQQSNDVLIKMEVFAAFKPNSNIISADLMGRYQFRSKGFAELGYRYQKIGSEIEDLRVNLIQNGPYVSLGLVF